MTSLKGNLNSVDLANIFQMLSLNQREGTLYIFEGASRKAISFGIDGVSMLSKGRQKSDALGRILLRHDRVRPEQLQAALDKRAESGRLLGQVLVEEGFCNRADVDEALQIQIQEEVYSLFIWKDAQFEFVEGEAEEEFRAEGVQRLTFNVNSVIMEAAKRVDEWEWIQSVVPDLQEIYRYTGANVDLADPIFQEPCSGKVLAAIDGRRSVEEVVDASYVNKFEVCKILAILFEGGAIERLPVEELRREADVALLAGDMVAGVKFLTRLIAVCADDPEPHRRLAEAYEADRELEKAAFHYRVHAECCAERHDVKSAFLGYKRIAELLPTDLSAVDRMIEVFASNPDGLEEHAKEIVERGKQLAEIYVELKRSSRAVQVLHRVVSLGPDDPDLRNRLISVYLASGMHGEAVAEFEALADAALAAKDYETAEKIYRKILSIEKDRPEIAQRLDQLVSKKRRHARNVRNLIVGAVLIAASAAGAAYALTWLKDKKNSQILHEAAGVERLAAARAGAAPVMTELDTLIKELSNRPVDPVQLKQSLAERRGRIEQVEKRVAATIAALGEVRRDFADLTEAEDAGLLSSQLDAKVGAIKKRVGEVQKSLRDEAEGLLESAQQTLSDYQSTRAALEKLDLAVKVAEDCEGWSISDRGQTCQDLRAQIRQYLKKFDETKASIEQKVERDDVDAAFDLAVGYLTDKDFPPRDLREEMPVPVRIVSRPPGARVMTKDGVDTGFVAGPRCVVMVSILKGASFSLELPGFNAGTVLIPAVKEVDAGTVLSKVKRVHNVPLEKTQSFRKATTDGKPLVAAPCATQRYLAVPGQRSCDVVDLRTGKIVQSIVCERPARASGVAMPRDGDDATLVLPTSEGTLLFFDAATGRSRGGWTDAREGIAADLTPAGGDVLAADERGNLYCVIVAESRKRWEHAVRSASGAPGAITTPCVVADDPKTGPVAWFGCEDGTVRAVSLADGREVRRIAPAEGGRVTAPVCVEPGYVTFVNRDQTTAKQSRVTKWSLAANAAEWTSLVAGDVRGAPMARGGTTYVVSTAGEVQGLRSNDGVRAVSTFVERGAKVLAEPVLDGDVLYVGTDAGALYALDLRSPELEPLWKFLVKTATGKPVAVSTRVVLAGGLVLFGAADSAVYALEGDGK